MKVTAPASGVSLGEATDADGQLVDKAVAAAKLAFQTWRNTPPSRRAECLKAFSQLVRENAQELAMIDAIDCGSPISEMLRDAEMGARGIDFYAGLVTEIKGETIPLGPNFINYTVRDPLGVVARIIAYNHPLMFATMRCAAPLAAGNTLIVKPAAQTPLSALRLAELVDDAGIFPAGVFNVITGARESGAALASHRDVARVAVIGSIPTGKAVLHAAVDTMKSVGLELGGKNALLAFPDADPSDIAAGAIQGMNLTWAGQSCGSTSRIFLHESHYEKVLEAMVEYAGRYVPGDPTDLKTTMGALIDDASVEKVERYVAWALEDGAQLVIGGRRACSNGNFYEPTIFRDVDMTMRIAREEIFGPVISVLRWKDEADLVRMVNDVEYGLTAAIFTHDLTTAHRIASQLEAGYIWVNHAGPHFIGVPFGGYKLSGIGREEGIEELLACTQVKNINIKLGS
ncbi:aldehyde dehydrogenase family protein [Pseudochelatococcus sp. B33]